LSKLANSFNWVK